MARHLAVPLVVTVLLGAGLTGCLAATDAPLALDATGLDPRLSQPLFPVLDGVQQRVASYDGVEIDNWVYLPDAPEGTQVPTLINFSPYWGNLAPTAATKGDAFGAYLVDFFVPRGYAVVLSSARGTGDSDGCFTIGGPGETEDMVAVVDHFASQPWSNGLVGAGGKSYDGTMAQALVTSGNEHVKAIFPVSPASEWYKYNYVNGVPYLIGGQTFNTYYVISVGWGMSALPPGETYEQFDAARLVTQDLACADNVDVQRAQYESMATGTYTDYWKARNYTASAGMIPDDLGVFYVHGLGDWNVKPDHMTPWLAEIPEGVFVKSWLGQWAHEYPTRSDLNATLLRFFDHFLKGVDTGLLAEPAVDVEDDTGTWRHEADWPPSRATPLTFWLSADYGLISEAPAEGRALFPGYPLSTAPFFDGEAFVSAPLEADLRYAGAPHVRLDLSSVGLGVDGTVAVTLYDVGNETWSPAERIVNQGFLDLRHRNSMDAPEPIAPGERFEAIFDLYPQDDVIPAGHRLALVLSGTSPDGAPVSVLPVGVGGTVHVHVGPATSITFPTIIEDTTLALATPPDDVGCWLC